MADIALAKRPLPLDDLAGADTAAADHVPTADGEGGVTWAAPGAPEGVATVYIHDGSAYQLAGGRIFIGPEDPASDGYTLADGDQWEDTSA